MALWHGCAMVHSRYPQRQGTGDIFEYSVDAIHTIGFTATMSYANSGFDQDYDGETWTPAPPTNFTELLQTTALQHLFGLDFTRHIFQLWTWANGPDNGAYAYNQTSDQLTNEYNEVYNACVYLLSTYSGKEFIIKNWEGDWQLLNSFNPDDSVPPYRSDRYAAFANIRQRAVRDARRDTPSTSRILYCVELNRCLDDFGDRIFNTVLSRVKPDMVGWSAYEAINYWTQGWELTARTSNFGAGNDVKGFAYGNGIAVAVGEGGSLSMSPDGGLKWYPRDSGFSGSDIFGVVWAPTVNIFVAVGAGGKISTSSDALTWSLQTSGTANALTGVVATSAGHICAFGASSTLLHSTNGTAWAAVTFSGGAPTTDYTCGVADSGSGKFLFGGTSGQLALGTGAAAVDASSGAGLGSNTVHAVATNGTRFVAGSDGGVLTTSATSLSTPFAANTSQFGGDAVLSIAYGNGVFVAVGTSGKISTSPDALTWTARSAGTGAYLRVVNYSVTEGTFAYGCDGATGYSLDGLTWIVNGQPDLGGAIVYFMFSAPGLVITGSPDGLITTAKYWHVQTNAEANIDFNIRKGYQRIKNAVPKGTPIAITEYGFPQDQSNFTGIGLDVGRMIQKVIDTATAVGMTGVIWWQIFDNEEQSPGVPRGFHLYSRDSNNTVPGPLSGAGVKYDAIL